jgi:hypothetical protein
LVEKVVAFSVSLQTVSTANLDRFLSRQVKVDNLVTLHCRLAIRPVEVLEVYYYPVAIALTRGLMFSLTVEREQRAVAFNCMLEQGSVTKGALFSFRVGCL